MKLSPLPDAVLEVMRLYYADPIKIGEDGTRHDVRLVSPTLGEAKVLAQLVLTISPHASLEIGLGTGGSAIAIAAARRYQGLKAKHVVLDPVNPRKPQVGLSEIAKCGLDSQVSWFPERSEVYFQGAALRGEKYDFIFVDGGHTIGQVVADAFFLHPVLRPRGVVVFHDGLLFSTAAAVNYLINEMGYKLLALPKDPLWRVAGRSIKYFTTLGIPYVSTVIPRMHRSVVALQRNG